MPVEMRRRRFTVDEYYAMAAARILTEDHRVELIDGQIIQLASISGRHAACVNRLTRLLVLQAVAAAIVQVQNPVRLSDVTEPQPDPILSRARADFYAAGHPRPDDTLLVIEVSHTTLDYDRKIKLPSYALARVPEVRIVDIDGPLLVYREPVGPEYYVLELRGRGDVLRPALLPTNRHSGLRDPRLSITGVAING